MWKTAALLTTLVVVVPFAALADDIVLHPNTSHYSEGELRLLLPAIERLSDTLGGTRLASGRRYPDQWGSQEFAAYTQGILAASGYTGKLVAAEWSEGRRVWILVAIPLPERIAW